MAQLEHWFKIYESGVRVGFLLTSLKAYLKKSRPWQKKQLFLDNTFKTTSVFGGDLLKSANARCARPISTREAMHIVLRSSQAKGKLSMLEKSRADRIDKLIKKHAKKFEVKIYQYANVGNHIHLLVLASHRDFFKYFLRTISGFIARIVLGAERGSAKKTKFWDQRPWSRFVQWNKDFKGVKKYVVQNFNEAMGFVAYKTRKSNRKILEKLKDRHLSSTA
jgi:REP element-mobilizing transposase RayT